MRLSQGIAMRVAMDGARRAARNTSSADLTTGEMIFAIVALIVVVVIPMLGMWFDARR